MLCYLTYNFDTLRKYAENDPNEEFGTTQSIVFVVSPLQALMEDQVDSFNREGMQCVYLHGNTEMKSGVIDGKFQLVYLSPEQLVQDLELCEMFRSPLYQQSLVAFVVDEAHCIDTW